MHNDTLTGSQGAQGAPWRLSDRGPREPRAAAGVALENIANNSTPPRPEVSKWALMNWLHLNSRVTRQQRCQSRAVGEYVGIRRGMSSGAAFSGLQSCGSTLCPHCGPKVAAARRENITETVAAHRANGGRVLFGTLTLRHRPDHRLADLLDAVSDGWGAATNGKVWAKDKRRHGIVGQLRVLETKHGGHGWHPHVHFLLFIDPTTAFDTHNLMASMFRRWAAAAARAGFEGALLDGQDLHEVRDDVPADVLGEYFAKFADASADTAAEDIGWEFTSSNSKTRGLSVTPRSLLEDAAAGDRTAARLWGEYELAMRGRRTIAYSRGLRSMLGLQAPTSAADAAAAADPDSVVVLEIATKHWHRIVRGRLRADLLTVAAQLGGTGAQEFLRRHGIPSAVPTHTDRWPVFVDTSSRLAA